MKYKFSDRLKEWTSYVGIALSIVAAAIPHFVTNMTEWTQFWQALQMGLGIALIFIPHSAGSTAVENESWSLLRAFSGQLPPQYAEGMKPLLQALASAIAKSQMDTVSPPPPPAPPATPPVAPPSNLPHAQPSPVQPQNPAAAPQAAAPPVQRPQPQPLVANPAAALHPM